MDTLFWWTGALVWSCVALVLAWLLLEVLWGVVVSASYLRASLTSARARKVRIPRRAVVRSFFQTWPGFIFYRNDGSTTISWGGGIWRGIGDWTVYPVAPPMPTAEETGG